MFVALIVVIICFLYFCNVKLVWIDRRASKLCFIYSLTNISIIIILGDFWTYLYLTIFNIFTFMLVWSLGVSIFTDPVTNY